MSPIPAQQVDAFVRREGEWVRHLIGARCWCRSSTGQVDPNCQEHDNMGSVYVDENEILGLVTQISQHKEIVMAGIALPGDCVFSPESCDTVSSGDKIVFTWPEPYGEGDAMIRAGREYDILTYEAVSSMYVGDQNKVKYIKDVDFMFVGKRIVWEWENKPAAGKKPRTGIKYVVKYKAYIEWVAFDIPVERVSHGYDIGTKVLLRKIHLASNG